MNKLRTIFMGTPDFAVPSLLVTAEMTDLIAVFCGQDLGKGRGLELAECSVKKAAQKLNVPIVQPTALLNEVETIKALKPDLIIVVAYGKLLPKSILDIPRLGCWNIHASMLPEFRGAAPVQWSLIHGRCKTGVTLMQMDVGMDTGPIILQKDCDIDYGDNVTILMEKLSRIGSYLLAESFELLRINKLPKPVKQPNLLASRAPILKKEDGLIDFSNYAYVVRNHIRGVDPWPGAHTYALINGERTLVKLFCPEVYMMNQYEMNKEDPGTIVGVSKAAIRISCGRGYIYIYELQLPSRKRLPAFDVCNGAGLKVGSVLG